MLEDGENIHLEENFFLNVHVIVNLCLLPESGDAQTSG